MSQDDLGLAFQEGLEPGEVLPKIVLDAVSKQWLGDFEEALGLSCEAQPQTCRPVRRLERVGHLIGYWSRGALESKASVGRISGHLPRRFDPLPHHLADVDTGRADAHRFWGGEPLFDDRRRPLGRFGWISDIRENYIQRSIDRRVEVERDHAALRVGIGGRRERRQHLPMRPIYN